MWDLENSENIYGESKDVSMSYCISSAPSRNAINNLHYSVIRSDSNNSSSVSSSSTSDATTVESSTLNNISTPLPGIQQKVANIDSHVKINDSIKDLEDFIDGLVHKGQHHNTDNKTAPNIHLMYERIIYELKSEIEFLRNFTQANESLLKDEIGFLRGELQSKNNLISTLVSSSIHSESRRENETNMVCNNRSNLLLIDKPQQLEQNENTSSHINNNNKNNNSNNNNSNNNNNHSKITDKCSSENKLNRKTSAKLKVELVGDSIICNLYPRGLSKYKDVNIKNFPGSSTRDMLDYIKPSVNRIPSEILVHVGTNDITTGTDTMENVRKILKLVKDEAPLTKLTFSSIIIRKDCKNIIDELNDLNSRLKSFCVKHHLGFIDNSNLDESCLDFKKLHLNRKGNSLLARNILNHLSES